MFVAVEFGLVAVDRARIDQLASAGDRRARVTQYMLSHLPFSLGGAQLGISIVSLAIGFLAEPLIAEVIEPLLGFLGEGAAVVVSVVLALTIATVAQMVLGELIPKSLAIAKPEQAALALSAPLRIFATIFKPVIGLLNISANKIVRSLGIEPQEELSHVRSLPELAQIFQASALEGTLAGTASTLLSRSVRFGEKTAADVLVPRVEIKAIEREKVVADLVELAQETGHSRIPVYDDDLDHIVGVVHVKAIHALPIEARSQVPVAQLMSDIVAVPETRDLEDVLSDMRRVRSHLVVVVDEYGGTAGILTLEDILEEIVGDIADEYDPLTPGLAVEQAPGTFVLSGALHPDEVHEAIGFVVPEGEYETLAGFVLDQLGHIPAPGETFEYDGWGIEVGEVDRHRVATVSITQPPPSPDEDEHLHRAAPPRDGDADRDGGEP